MSTAVDTTVTPLTIDPSDLRRLSFAELEPVFERLARPDEHPRGDLRGRAVALVGAERLPGRVRGSVTGLAARLIAPVWRGKRFDDAGGVNLWLRGGSPLRFARFAVRRDAGGVIRFDYDLRTNPAPLRRISAELRLLAPGLHLARMDVEIAGRARPALYFTLSGPA